MVCNALTSIRYLGISFGFLVLWWQRMEVWDIVNSAVLLLSSLLSIFGNSLVLVSVKKFHWLRLPTHYSIACLAVWDICNGFPLFVSVTTTESLENSNNTTGYEVSCKLQSFLAIFCTLGEGLCILVIAVDRLIFLNWPLRYYNMVTDHRMKVAMACCPAVAFVISVLSIAESRNKMAPRPCLLLDAVGRLNMIVNIAIGVSMLIALIVLYLKISFIAREARRTGHRSDTSQSVSPKSTTRIMVYMIAVVVCSYLAYCVLYFISTAVNHQLSQILQLVGIWIAKVCMHLYSVCSYVYT